jgi:RHS repeat-associated protein
VYDGVGRREKKTINANLTEFLYDGVNPVQETSGTNVLANILTGLGVDEFFVRTDITAGTTSYFLPDVLRSAVALTDPTSVIQTEYTYQPFGKTTTTGAPSSNSFQYTGRENDGIVLYYHRMRYYNPELQRFVTEDPIEFQGGDLNLYNYVHNAPLTYSDPYGLEAPLPLPIFPGTGGRTCIALSFAGVRCEPPPENKSNPPLPKAPDPQLDPRDPCWSCKPPFVDPPPPSCVTFGTHCQFGKAVPTPAPESLLDKLGASWSWFWQNYFTKRLDPEGH